MQFAADAPAFVLLCLDETRAQTPPRDAAGRLQHGLLVRASARTHACRDVGMGPHAPPVSMENPCGFHQEQPLLGWPPAGVLELERVTMPAAHRGDALQRMCSVRF